MTTVAGIHQGLDTHANRPAANAVTAGTLYSCSDHSLIYISDGSSWSTYATLGSGGSSQSFLGTNSVGSGTEASVADTWYAKSITAPADGIITSIDCYHANNADGATVEWMAGVWADSSGPSGAPLFGNNVGLVGMDNAAGSGGGDPGWFSMPCGLYVPDSTTVWIGVQPGVTTVNMYRETTGGTDETVDLTASFIIGAGFFSWTSTTKDYSIRASFLSL